MRFAPKGKTFVLLPAIEFDPPWTKNYFFKINAVQTLGGDVVSEDAGEFKGYNYIYFMYQYNFNLL